MSPPPGRTVVLVVLSTVLFVVGAACDETGLESAIDPASLNAEAIQSQSIQWIDDYRLDQVLFHDRDLATLRGQLADSPEQALQWWKTTAQIRSVLESPDWKETHDWFREFLRVQAMFSDQQIDDLRTRAWESAAQGSIGDFVAVLSEIAGFRSSLGRAAADDRAAREYKLRSFAAFKRDQAAGRVAAKKAASFGSGGIPRTFVRPRREMAYLRPPLVTSSEVARWSVARIFWRW